MSDHLIAEAHRHAMALPTTHPTHADIAWYVREVSELRAEVEESKARERAAIASWDEERQRALREGGRVVELRAELALLRECRAGVMANANSHHAELKEAIARAERAEGEVKMLGVWREGVIENAWAHKANLEGAIARAERAEAERDQLRAELATCDAAYQGLVGSLRVEVERWELAFQEQYARAESAEREVERRKRFSSRTAIAEHRACRAEAEVERLRAGIGECLRTNAHLADGEDCTLIGLKRCLHDPATALRQSALDATPRPSE